MKKIINFLLNLIFPIFCFSCGKGTSYFCEECFSKTVYLDPQVCHGCKKVSLLGKNCELCRNDFCFDNLIVACFYDGVMEKMIKRFKYDFCEELKDILGLILLNAFRKYIKFDDIILTAVPLHRKRYLNRGFNQSELLARFLANQTGFSYMNILKRRKNTHPQAELNRKERLINVKDSFVLINNNFDKSKTIFLIDDVVSTGMTLNECAKMLKENGVKAVYGLVIARG